MQNKDRPPALKQVLGSWGSTRTVFLEGHYISRFRHHLGLSVPLYNHLFLVITGAASLQAGPQQGRPGQEGLEWTAQRGRKLDRLEVGKLSAGGGSGVLSGEDPGSILLKTWSRGVRKGLAHREHSEESLFELFHLACESSA